MIPSEIDYNSIQIVNKDTNNYISQDGNFEKLVEYKLVGIKIDEGEIINPMVEIYIPKKLINRIKLVKHSNNNVFITIAYFLEGEAKIPSIFNNFML